MLLVPKGMTITPPAALVHMAESRVSAELRLTLESALWLLQAHGHSMQPVLPGHHYLQARWLSGLSPGARYQDPLWLGGKHKNETNSPR